MNKREAEQFERDHPGWKAETDDHGNIYYSNPYIDHDATTKPTPEIIDRAAKAAEAEAAKAGPPPSLSPTGLPHEEYPPPPLLPPPRQRSSHSRDARLLAESVVGEREIDLVCFVIGHSHCSRSKFRLRYTNMCIMTLTLLEDSLMVQDGKIIEEVKRVVQQSSSSSLPVSAFIDTAKDLRDKKVFFPKKVVEGSIRARCGSVKENEQSTFTNQFFFGGETTQTNYEGVFAVEFPESLEQYRATKHGDMPDMPPPVQIKDISSKSTPDGVSLLTRTPGNNPTPSGKNQYTYKKTTDIQKEIIASESQNPGKTFLGSSDEYSKEYTSLLMQRALFCMSLNFGETPIESLRSCVDSCKGMDVMDLQRYYDLIVKWEQENRKYAHENFEQFIQENGIPDVPALRMLIDKRRLQLGANPWQRGEENFYDAQLVQSMYLEDTCHDIIQKIYSLYPGRKILVILEGCRVASRVTDGNTDPYASDHGEDDDELYTQGKGGARRKNIKNTNQKNTNQKNKKTYKKKTYKKKTYKKKTYKKKTYKKKINSCKNKK